MILLLGESKVVYYIDTTVTSESLQHLDLGHAQDRFLEGNPDVPDIVKVPLILSL